MAGTTFWPRLAAWKRAGRSHCGRGSIYGPYEHKIVLAQGDTDINGPHQGALVDTPSGEWWFIHFQDAGLYGRVAHLQPVQWEDGWPLMGKDCEPVQRHAKPKLPPQPRCAPQASDEFTGPQLGLQWQWHANHRDDWCSLTARPGWLRLYPQLAAASLNQQPNLLLQKFPARSFAVETALEFHPAQDGEEAGLVVTGRTQVMLGIQRRGTANWVVWRANDRQEYVRETKSSLVRFRVDMRDGGLCSFSFADAGTILPLPATFQAHKGVWIGGKVGFYSLRRSHRPPQGHADVDYFRFEQATL